MPELSEEDRKTLERLRAAAEARRKIPSSQRKPITNPEKFSFPPGIDENGKPFAVVPRTKRNRSREES